MSKMKNKKVLSLVLSLILTLCLLCGCGGSSEESAEESEAIVIKMAFADPEDSVPVQAALEFEAWMEEQTAGAVDVQLFPSGQLGGDKEVLESIKMDTVQVSVMSTGVISAFDDRLAVLDLPYLFDTYEDCDAAVKGELGDLYAEWVAELGFECLGIGLEGTKCVATNAKPINTLSDLEGLKLRVMETPQYISIYKALGTNPTPMNYNEIYTGLQQGTIDAIEQTALVTYTSKFYEVVDYVSLTNQIYSNSIIVTSPTFMDSLDDETRALFEEGVQEFLVDKERQMAVDAESDAIQAMKDAGVEVNEVDPSEMDAFKEAVEPVYDDFRELIGDEDMDKVLSLAGRE